MPALLDILLFQLKHLSVGNFNLLFHQIYSDHFFRNRMFHLQAGVHLKEIIVAVFINKEFDSTRTDVVHSFSRRYRFFTHVFSQFGSDENRRSLFYDFLVTALHGTFAFAQMNDVSMLVTKNLELDVMRLFNELLQVNRVIAKGRQ